MLEGVVQDLATLLRLPHLPRLSVDLRNGPTRFNEHGTFAVTNSTFSLKELTADAKLGEKNSSWRIPLSVQT